MAEAAWVKVVTARADLNFPSEQEAREALRKATDRTDAVRILRKNELPCQGGGGGAALEGRGGGW